MLYVVLFLLYVVLFVMYFCALSTLRKVILTMNKVFSVYDSCSGIFSDPLIAPNDAVAKRIFDNAISHPSVPKYIRDDSVLYCLAYFDNKTGYFTSDVPPYVVSRGSSVVVPDPSLESDTHDLPEVTNSET